MGLGFSPLGNVAFKAGIVGGFILTVGMAMLRAIEATPFNVELAIGSLLTRSFEPMSWIIGFGIHLALCGAVALVYAAGFEAFKRSGMVIGMAFGFLHWIVSGVAMGIMPAMYSLVPELLGVPGFFGMYFGGITVVGNCVFHLLFGAAVGSLYDAARLRYFQTLTSRPAPVIATDEAEEFRRVA